MFSKNSNKFQDFPIVIGVLLFFVPLILLISKKKNPNNTNQIPENKIEKKNKKRYTGWRVVINVQTFIDSLENNVETLISLISETDLYLIGKVSTDKEEEEIMSKISSTGIFEKGFNQHKLLFCETISGKVAFGRQLECTLFIDNDFDSLNELNRFIPYIGYIGNENIIKDLKNGIYGNSLSNLFENLNKVSL